jgi:hypothetical protein
MLKTLVLENFDEIVHIVSKHKITYNNVYKQICDKLAKACRHPEDIGLK